MGKQDAQMQTAQERPRACRGWARPTAIFCAGKGWSKLLLYCCDAKADERAQQTFLDSTPPSSQAHRPGAPPGRPLVAALRARPAAASAAHPGLTSRCHPCACFCRLRLLLPPPGSARCFCCAQLVARNHSVPPPPHRCRRRSLAAARHPPSLPAGTLLVAAAWGTALAAEAPARGLSSA